jgi:NADPH-dependent curcumin reductase CurA
MPAVNRRFLLDSRPEGRVSTDDFVLVEEPLPQIADGEILVRTTWLSLDPTNRGWMTDAPSYMPPVAIGEVMRGFGLGRVVASRHPDHPEGQLVQGLTGWQDYVVFGAAEPPMVVPAALADLPPSRHLGALGMTGLTAYFGLTEAVQVRPGDTVVISAAAGAVGSVAGQIVKILGGRAVGIAGGRRKCDWLVDDLGFDAAVDYKAEDWRDQLRAATPDGIDVDFENVGGPVMEAVFARLNVGASVALCGLISGYNDEELLGPRNFGALIAKRARVQGFLVLDHFPRYHEAATQLARWMDDGLLVHRETVVEGLEEAPDALNMLFDGRNTGKLVVHVAD